MDTRNYTLAAFSMHHAVESMLIAAIKIASGFRFTAHNLLRMIRIALLFTDELKDVFELNATEGLQMFNLLRTAYSEARYREIFIADEVSVKMLVPKVEIFLDKAMAIYYQFVAKDN